MIDVFVINSSKLVVKKNLIEDDPNCPESIKFFQIMIERIHRVFSRRDTRDCQYSKIVK